jgi:hypothetical protein
VSYSGDRSSAARKRALRRLAREQRVVYRELYEQTRQRVQTHDQARGRARTLLRYRFPDRYLQLYAEEQVGPGTEVPPEVRSKAWLRASAALAELLGDAYRALFGQAHAGGLNNSCAYDMASSQLRAANQELFARLLAEEIRCSLREIGVPDSPVACAACGGMSWRRGRHVCAEPCGLVHPRCVGCDAVAGECYWTSATTVIELLTVHTPTLMAAFLDAIAHRRPPGRCPACNGQPCPRHAADQDLAGQYQSLAEALHDHLAVVSQHRAAARDQALGTARRAQPGQTS